MGLEFDDQIEEVEDFEELKIENYELNPGEEQREKLKRRSNKKEMYDPDLIEELEEVF